MAKEVMKGFSPEGAVELSPAPALSEVEGLQPWVREAME